MPSHPQPGCTLLTERREFARINDHLIVEYRPFVGDLPLRPTATRALTPVVLDELIRSSQGVLALSHTELEQAQPLLPWLARLEWTLETLLRSMLSMMPTPVFVPAPSTVTLSAGGLRFPCPQVFPPKTLLHLRLFLPPLDRVELTGEVIESQPGRHLPSQSFVAVQFVRITDEDRERIVRYVIRRQTELLRARHSELSTPAQA